MTALHALFQRRIAGDDALLGLARQRFEEAGLAAEVYAGSSGELEHLLRFVPDGARAPTVHLPRDADVLDPHTGGRVEHLAHQFGDRVSGFVLHDRRHLPDRLPELADRAAALSAALTDCGGARLFVEYAAGLRPEQFVAVARTLVNAPRVGVCVDTGHVGIRAARRAFARLRPDVGRDLTALGTDDPDLPELVGDVRAAVAAALPVLLRLLGDLAALGNPVHLHLHDGHPLVAGLQDHHGFLFRLPIPFADDGAAASLDPLYGVTGLRRIVETVASAFGPDGASLTLEIHEHGGRLPLPEADAARFFGHWRDLGNAERMNLWLRDLADNATLVRAFLPAGATGP